MKPGKPTVFLSSALAEQEPMFSPDGRWLAYQSINAGRTEVFVRPFPGPGGLQQISTGSGAFPVWSRAKPELLFMSFNPLQIFAATYTASADSFRADKPRVWSTAGVLARPRLRSLNVHPDGERFVVSPAQDAQTITKQDKLVFIINFSEELKRITAAK